MLHTPSRNNLVYHAPTKQLTHIHLHEIFAVLRFDFDMIKYLPVVSCAKSYAIYAKKLA